MTERFNVSDWALRHRSFIWFLVIVILLMLWWVCLYAAHKNQIESDRRLIFEDTLPPAVEVLDLTFRR